ncbi:hypothetical protein MED121_14609 [Marinomonas sp. MED121]|uniref:hypothetical protein n=1 Tax=Marinomonas sp. MED121 TaxID=314277 RepID=UPI0000691078|nr:hypothetical protein [Marinomonas sp. MED121]EAQ67167.1 hypothetical protein MED121_14609 [Marinomonas sp. MED121]
MRKEKKKITQEMIYRAVASSTAIETGQSIKIIEEKIKANRKKYSSLHLSV